MIPFCPHCQKSVRLFMSNNGKGVVKELLLHIIAGNVNRFKFFKRQLKNIFKI